MAQEDQILTVGQVAELLGVAPATVVGWADRKDLRSWKLPSGHRRFLRSDLDPFMPPARKTEASA